jgi:hypothetical protein
LLAALVTFHAGRAVAQVLTSPDETRQGMLREAMLGLLPVQVVVGDTDAKQKCLTLPFDPPNDRLQGPHGSVLIITHCIVSAYENLPGTRQHRWTDARYQWISVFTAEDPTRGAGARDTVTEEEVVLFEAAPNQRSRAIWHARYDTGAYGVLSSITPQTAPASQGTTLLSVMSCVNGTGGCSQEFLHLHANEHWFPVRKQWLGQLPNGFAGRIRTGIHIAPRTLRGEGGFYGGRDPNCCPSQSLIVDLALRDDSLVLRRYRLKTN